MYCQWGSWGSAGGCSRTCGGGTRTKVRSKTRTEINTACSGSATKVESCNTAKCQDKYTLQYYYFVIANYHLLLQSLTNHNKISFLHPKVYCQWGSWFGGGCSKTCGGGTQTMMRQKTQIEVRTTCNGENVKQVSCNTEKCPGKS